MGKQRDRALMLGRIGVLMDQFVERWTGRHCVEQQNQGDQQRGENRLVVQFEMARYDLQPARF